MALWPTVISIKEKNRRRNKDHAKQNKYALDLRITYKKKKRNSLKKNKRNARNQKKSRN